MTNKQQIIQQCVKKAKVVILTIIDDLLVGHIKRHCIETGDCNYSDNDNNTALDSAKEELIMNFDKLDDDHEIIPFYEEEKPRLFKLIKNEIISQVKNCRLCST